MHIVTIRRNGAVEGHQLRVGAGDSGNTKYFASLKLGGSEASLAAAQATADEMNLPATGPRGGSKSGRLLRTSKTGESGIRFVWVAAANDTAILRVVATWMHAGRPRCASYSVESNGLEGALDKALAARTSAGAPKPNRANLIEHLRVEYASL